MKNLWVLVKKFAILSLSLVVLFTSCSRSSKNAPLNFHFGEVKSFAETCSHYYKGNFLPHILNIVINPINSNKIYVALDFGMFESNDKGISWVNLKVPQDGIRNAAIDNKGNLYLTYFDSVWISYDDGANWKEILSNKELGRFSNGYNNFVEVSDNKIYVAGGSKLLESDDSGLNFHEVKITDTFRMVGDRIERVCVDPTNSNKILVIDNHKLFFSSDAGKSFKLLTVVSNSYTYEEVWDAVLCKSGTIVAIAQEIVTPFVFHYDLLLSRDGGKIWKVQEKNIEFSGKLVKDPYHDDNVFILGTGLYRLNNCGSSYQYLGVSAPSAIAFDKDNPDHFYVGTSCGTLLETRNGSGNLKIIDRDDFRVTSITVANNEVYVAKRGIYRSKDLIHWEKLSESGDFVAVSKKFPHLILRGDGGWSPSRGIFIYDEHSKNCEKLSDEKVYSFAPDSEGLNVYIGTEHGVYKFSFGSQKLVHIAFSEEITLVFVDKSNSNIIYAARGNFEGGNAIYRSTDGGKTWNFCDDDLLQIKDENDKINLSSLEWPIAIFADGKNIYISIYPSFPGQQNMYIGYDRLKGGLFRSNDSGKTWNYINSMSEDKGDSYIIVNNVFEYNGRVFITYGNSFGDLCNTLEYSTDLKEWKQMETVPSSTYVSSFYLDESTRILYIGTMGGIYTVEVGGD